MHVCANIGIKPSDNYLTNTIIPFFTDFTLLFMLVSAFSMCCGYYDKIKNGLITPNAFYKKRYMRILPFFALLNVINLIFEPSLKTLQEVYTNLTLGFNLLPLHNIEVIGVGWFLGIIFVFYMMFPFFVFLLDSKKRAWLVLAIVTGLLFIAFTRFGNPTRSNIIFDMPYFMVGGIIYLYREKLATLVGKKFVVSTVVLIAYIIAYFAVKRGLDIYSGYLAQLLLFALILIFALHSKNIVLNNPVVKFISDISMEIYLCHMVMFRFVEKIHLENFINNKDLLYVVTSLGVIICAICFARIFKWGMGKIK